MRIDLKNKGSGSVNFYLQLINGISPKGPNRETSNESGATAEAITVDDLPAGSYTIGVSTNSASGTGGYQVRVVENTTSCPLTRSDECPAPPPPPTALSLSASTGDANTLILGFTESEMDGHLAPSVPLRDAPQRQRERQLYALQHRRLRQRRGLRGDRFRYRRASWLLVPGPGQTLFRRRLYAVRAMEQSLVAGHTAAGNAAANSHSHPHPRPRRRRRLPQLQLQHLPSRPRPHRAHARSLPRACGCTGMTPTPTGCC